MSRRPYKIAVYIDAGGGWRWRMVASNGRIVADGSEGYQSKAGALRAARKLVVMVRENLIEGQP